MTLATQAGAPDKNNSDKAYNDISEAIDFFEPYTANVERFRKNPEDKEKALEISWAVD